MKSEKELDTAAMNSTASTAKASAQNEKSAAPRKPELSDHAMSGISGGAGAPPPPPELSTPQ